MRIDEAKHWILTVASILEPEPIIVKEVAKEFIGVLNKCDSVEKLVRWGQQVFSIEYVPTLRGMCWRPFRERMYSVSPEDEGLELVAVDVAGIFRANFHLFAEEASQKTLNKLSALRGELATSRDDMFIVCLDSPTSWRREIYPEYKGSRDEKTPSLVATWDALKVDLRKQYNCMEFDGNEADDIVASIALTAKMRKQKAVLVSNDHDVCQCLGSGVTVFSPSAGEFRDEHWLLEKHSIKPSQVVDWLCMRGKDDVPSAWKIGSKTASKLLAMHGTFTQVWLASDSLTPAVSKSVCEFAKEDYWIAAKLHRLKTDLPVIW